MDFASLPPEINSARIYAGPGSGPLLAAASAWEALSAELGSAASSYESAIDGLTAGPWLGPAAAAMAAAAAPYISWLRITSEQAEQTGNQAVLAAAAYEAAFAETVPPPVVAGNRSLLAALVATNFFGQNTSAIATTEAQYGEMWAQDTGAMQSYAAASASATRLEPLTSPPASTSSGGSGDQAAAVNAAANTSAGDAQGAVSSIQQSFSAVPNALTNLASPSLAFPGFGGRDLLGLLADLSAVFVDPELGAAGLAADTTLGIDGSSYDVGGYYTGVHTDDIVSGWAGVQPWPGNAAAPPTSFPVLTNPASTVTGGFGQATFDRTIVGAAGMGGRGARVARHDDGAAGRDRRGRRTSHRLQRGKPVQPDGPGEHGRARHGRHHGRRWRGTPGADRGARAEAKGCRAGRGSRSAADSGGRPDHEHRRRATGAGLPA